MRLKPRLSSLAARAAAVGAAGVVLACGALLAVLLQDVDGQSAGSQATVLCAAAIAVVACMVALVQHRLLAPLSAIGRALEGISATSNESANIQAAWKVLYSYGTPLRVQDGALFAGKVRINDSTEIVDAITRLVGGTATVFLGDRRIATNVMTADGRRATGTTLAPGPVYDAVLRDERPFRGEATILGESYVTAYDPIRDSDYCPLPQSHPLLS